MFNFAKFKGLLEETGVSKSHIARKLGVKESQARYFFRDKEDPNKKTRPLTDAQIQIIADCLWTTPAYLTDETDIKEKPIPTNEDGLSEKQIELIQLIRSMSPLEVDLLLAQARIEIARRKSQD